MTLPKTPKNVKANAHNWNLEDYIPGICVNCGVSYLSSEASTSCIPSINTGAIRKMKTPKKLQEHEAWMVIGKAFETRAYSNKADDEIDELTESGLCWAVARLCDKWGVITGGTVQKMKHRIKSSLPINIEWAVHTCADSLTICRQLDAQSYAVRVNTKKEAALIRAMAAYYFAFDTQP